MACWRPHQSPVPTTATRMRSSLIGCLLMSGFPSAVPPLPAEPAWTSTTTSRNTPLTSCWK